MLSMEPQWSLRMAQQQLPSSMLMECSHDCNKTYPKTAIDRTTAVLEVIRTTKTWPISWTLLCVSCEGNGCKQGRGSSNIIVP